MRKVYVIHRVAYKSLWPFWLAISSLYTQFIQQQGFLHSTSLTYLIAVMVCTVYSCDGNLSIVTSNDTNTMHYKKLEHNKKILFLFLTDGSILWTTIWWMRSKGAAQETIYNGIFCQYDIMISSSCMRNKFHA